MEDKKNLIGERMRQARIAEKPKATQKDISARLETMGINLTESSVAKIEQGIRPVTDIQLVAIARVLRVSPAWLLGASE